MSQRSIEVKVGVLILLALGLLGTFVIVMGGLSFEPTYTVYVDFDNPGGLQGGAPVRIAGVKVDKVKELQFRGGEVDPKTNQVTVYKIPHRPGEKNGGLLAGRLREFQKQDTTSNAHSLDESRDDGHLFVTPSAQRRLVEFDPATKQFTLHEYLECRPLPCGRDGLAVELDAIDRSHVGDRPCVVPELPQAEQDEVAHAARERDALGGRPRD